MIVLDPQNVRLDWHGTTGIEKYPTTLTPFYTTLFSTFFQIFIGENLSWIFAVFDIH